MAKDPTARIQLLEKHLTKKTDTFNPNPLLELVALSRHEDPEVVHSAIWALHRVFIKIIGDGRLGRAILRQTDDDEDEEIDLAGEGSQVRGWMMKRLGEYLDVLGGLLRDSEEALRVGLIFWMTWSPESNQIVISCTSSLLLAAVVIARSLAATRPSSHPHPLCATTHPPSPLPNTFAPRIQRFKRVPQDCRCKSGGGG
jgi:hypothetical protein